MSYISCYIFNSGHSKANWVVHGLLVIPAPMRARLLFRRVPLKSSILGLFLNTPSKKSLPHLSMDFFVSIILTYSHPHILKYPYPQILYPRNHFHPAPTKSQKARFLRLSGFVILSVIYFTTTTFLTRYISLFLKTTIYIPAGTLPSQTWLAKLPSTTTFSCFQSIAPRLL